jgi:hypothetical protein
MNEIRVPARQVGAVSNGIVGIGVADNNLANAERLDRPGNRRREADRGAMNVHTRRQLAQVKFNPEYMNLQEEPEIADPYESQ